MCAFSSEGTVRRAWGQTPDFKGAGFGLPKDGYQDNQPYVKGTLKLFEYIRKVHGDDLELIHDMHERIEPIEAVESG